MEGEGSIMDLPPPRYVEREREDWMGYRAGSRGQDDGAWDDDDETLVGDGWRDGRGRGRY